MLATIRSLESQLPNYIVMDRGHVFSSGKAWVCLWFEARAADPPASNSIADSRDSKRNRDGTDGHGNDEDDGEESDGGPWTKGADPWSGSSSSASRAPSQPFKKVRLNFGSLATHSGIPI